MMTTRAKSEKHRHEANYAFWDWAEDTTVLTIADFTSGNCTRVRFMTTKDAIEEVAKAATADAKVSYLDMLTHKAPRKEQPRVNFFPLTYG